MARQLQYQQRFEPLLDIVTTVPFIGCVYPDEIYRTKSIQPELPQLISPPEFDGYFGAVYPDTVRRKTREAFEYIEPRFNENTVATVPFFNLYVHPPFQLFRRRKSSTKYPSVFYTELPPTVFTGNYHSLIEFFNLKIRLDVKKAVDSGVVAA